MNKDNFYTPSRGELEIVMSYLMKWGWDIAVEDIDDDHPISGLVVGDSQFIDDVIGENNPHFIIYTCNDGTKSKTHQ